MIEHLFIAEAHHHVAQLDHVPRRNRWRFSRE
jgi:hypothetical protein